jgi:hypothetical protein
VFGVGVDGGREGAYSDADCAAEKDEEDGFGEELDADVSFGGAECAAEADFGATFEDGDDHDVGHSYRADEEGDGAEAQEEVVEGALRFGSSD